MKKVLLYTAVCAGAVSVGAAVIFLFVCGEEFFTSVKQFAYKIKPVTGRFSKQTERITD